MTAALAAGSALVIWIAVASLDWRITHDTPLLLYQGFLIERLGLVPYRDFWDNNPPGTQLLHALVGRLFGHEDRALRWLDLGMLALTLTATVRALKRLDLHVAWGAAAVWGLLYLGHGAGFQRDDVVTLLTSLALAVTLSRWTVAARAATIGLLFGLAATLKPPALVALPFLLGYLAHAEDSDPPTSRLARLFVWAGLGVGMPLLAVFLYLWATGAVSAFLEMARGYWPLYTRVSGGLATIQSPLFNLYSGYRVFGRLQWWLLPAVLGLAVGLYVTRRDDQKRRVVLLLGGLAAGFLAYVGIQGKFFGYHWYPFHYCLALLASLCLLDLGHGVPRLVRGLPALGLLAFLYWNVKLPLDFQAQRQGQQPAVPKGGRPDEIATFLRANLQPGDTVQPLDWTGGVIHGMLIAGAKPATPFLYDFPFYHHVSSPYVFELRGRFLESLRAARPRYVIEIPGEEKPWVRGLDTTRDFNKLRRFLETNYVEVVNRNGYVIYERRPGYLPFRRSAASSRWKRCSPASRRTESRPAS